MWFIDGTLTGTTIQGQSEHGSNSNEGVHYILKDFRTWVSHEIALVSYEILLLPNRDAVDLFYNPSLLGFGNEGNDQTTTKKLSPYYRPTVFWGFFLYFCSCAYSLSFCHFVSVLFKITIQQIFPFNILKLVNLHT